MPTLLSPQAVYDKLQRGEAKLVDIRNRDEYIREHIEGAENIPLTQLSVETQLKTQDEESKVIIFHCLSGQRTLNNQAVLQQDSGEEVYILEGGLTAWKKAGLSVIKDKSQPRPIMQQVQIIAGFLVLLGVVLGASVSSWFYLLSAFVGAGLMFAGLSGYCGMAILLSKMPWNQPKDPNKH